MRGLFTAARILGIDSSVPPVPSVLFPLFRLSHVDRNRLINPLIVSNSRKNRTHTENAPDRTAARFVSVFLTNCYVVKCGKTR